MAKLAIKGHPKGGEEVIEILKMLGGVNRDLRTGISDKFVYFIEDGLIVYQNPVLLHNFTCYTIEEFLEKFPYKVGDTVIAYAEGCLAQFTIQDMRWNHKLNKVEYKICSSWLDANLIMRRCKQETMDKASKAVFDASAQCCDISNKIIKKETMKKEISGAIVDKFICLEGYDFYDDKGNIIDTKEITMKKQSKYPKTYEECLKILGYNVAHTIPMNHGHKGLLFMRFQRLLILRDAYWKLAGEQMGLGKPWEPDWYDDEQGRYMIMVYENKPYKDMSIVGTNFILVFPTEEMRDAFYDNFKELIEECKEFL